MRSRDRILANLESIYRESYDRAKEAGDRGRMIELDSGYMRDQLMLEILLDVLVVLVVALFFTLELLNFLAGARLEDVVHAQVYLTDPDVPIDTNHLEHVLRAIPMGRKAWLFSWTELGAKYVGIVQSLIVTCRLHQIDPYDYLVDVLQRVGQHPASQVHLLTPRLWKQHFAANPLRSALHDLLAKATTL